MKSNDIKTTRILIIGAIYNPAFSGAGYMLQLLLKSRFAVIFILMHINTRFVNSLSDLEKCHVKKLFLFFKYTFCLLYNLLFNKPDYVILNPAFNRNAFIKDSIYHLMCVNLGRCKVIWWSHAWGLRRFYDESGKLMRMYIKYVVKSVHRVVTSGNRQNNDFDFLVTNTSLKVIHHGIPSHAYPVKTQKNRKTIQVLYFANFDEYKGWRILFKAAEQICSQNKGVNFNFYGNPAGDCSLDEIHKCFENTKFRDRIIFHGPAYGSKKYDAFSSADIFCFPTFFPAETFGIVNLEAMNAGLAIIATDHANIPEIVINEHGGLIIPKNDVNALSKAIIKLAGDHNLRHQMELYNQRRFAEFYSLNDFERGWIDFIKELDEEKTSKVN